MHKHAQRVWAQTTTNMCKGNRQNWWKAVCHRITDKRPEVTSLIVKLHWVLMHKMKHWLKPSCAFSHVNLRTWCHQLWASEVCARASLQFGETQIAKVFRPLSLYPLFIPPSLHPSFLAVGHFFPSGTLPCIMQQGPYHSPVIDIPSLAKLIAGTPVKQPHETEGRGKRWWELSVHCMCKWEVECEKQSKDKDTTTTTRGKMGGEMRIEKVNKRLSDLYLEREREFSLSLGAMCFALSPSAVSTTCLECWIFTHCAHTCIPFT